MNRLRGRKKTREEPAISRPSVEESSPFKLFGKGKKSQEEPKVDVDITAALPSNDDFRTSLLMTGLSARFSMLREQDDPTSKLGKALDDSVLYPKRQSRMDFGLGGGLDDIAEVESIRAPNFPRMDSFQSDDASSMTGSVMTRGKPTEGNNLFGGRQKIYKINVNGSAKSGGLPGRALYDDDVALSAFQRWRQAEKDRDSLEEDAQESNSLRPESPSQSDFNRRRETSSTTSSAPSGGRNSTAATSVTSSQPTASLKDWQPSSSAANPASLERSVTRTRRLYEQGLTQDMQDHQTSALSRIDTLSKQRYFGARTPETGGVTASPSAGTFMERTADRRPAILGKASAPNLRSFTPPITGSSQASPSESVPKLPILEAKTYTTSPPLSPPISESEELPSFAIQPNDWGKATAMGVFARPAQPYDESRYAQRQRQAQQGRETPTTRTRAESNSSLPTDRSRSSSSMHRTPFEKSEPAPVSTQPTVQEEPAQGHTFLDIDDDDDVPERNEAPAHSAPQLTIERPSDQDHPAFRKSALPTPLSLGSRSSSEPLAAPETSPKADGPADSPTLGPGAGLSGMVRQHLRNVSTASSVYGAGPEEPETHGQAPQAADKAAMEHLSVGSNPWDQHDTWEHQPTADMSSPTSPPSPDYARNPGHASPTMHHGENGQKTGKETDEFARHLADGARRVRERLTSYVDSDHSRSTSPSLPPIEPAQEVPPPRGNAFSALRSKSSRGSLRDHSQTRSKKKMGLGATAELSPPPSNKYALDASDVERNDISTKSRAASDDRGDASEKEGGGVHAGLKAFRQARRELQRMKEAELQQRHHLTQKASHEPQPPTYGRIPSDEVRAGSRSRTGSVPASERERSGSEASNSGQRQHRPPPLRTAPAPIAEQNGGYGHGGTPNGMSPMTRGPVSLGGDFKRSQMVSPYGHTSDASPRFYEQGVAPAASTPNLGATHSAPPLPPINPRRKTITKFGEEELPLNSPPMPHSPEKTRGARGPVRMSDDEDANSHYRQRLRQAARNPNGGADRGRPQRVSPPPFEPSRNAHAHANMSGGMI